MRWMRTLLLSCEQNKRAHGISEGCLLGFMLQRTRLHLSVSQEVQELFHVNCCKGQVWEGGKDAQVTFFIMLVLYV